MRTRFAQSVKALLAGPRGKRGESLVEVLTAIVIGALALLMMGMAISVAANMAMDSRDRMDGYYEANNAAVSGEVSALGTGSVKLEEAGSTTPTALVSSESMAVRYFENGEIGSAGVVLFESSSSGGGA